MSTRATLAATDVFRNHGGILTTGQALALGIHPRTLYQMRDEGMTEAVTRGVFGLPSPTGLAHPDLVAVALRVPRATLCLISALAYHDATSEVPHEVQIALPRGTKAPRLTHPPLRVFWFSGPALTEGIAVAHVDGIELKVFDLAKTVVDCFRFRNKLGHDVAMEALNRAVRDKGVHAAELLRYARLCHIESVLLPYVEAMQ